jgi:hypothetical protein
MPDYTNKQMFCTFFKPVVALVAGSLAWVAQIIADAIPSTDMTWTQALIKDVGLPTAMLVLVIWGIIALYKELKTAQAGRLSDRDTFQTLLLSITAEATKNRERQIIATDNLSSEFARLADKINSGTYRKHN